MFVYVSWKRDNGMDVHFEREESAINLVSTGADMSGLHPHDHQRLVS